MLTITAAGVKDQDRCHERHLRFMQVCMTDTYKVACEFFMHSTVQQGSQLFGRKKDSKGSVTALQLLADSAWRGLQFAITLGVVKQISYNPRSSMESLTINPHQSQAATNQRSG